MFSMIDLISITVLENRKAIIAKYNYEDIHFNNRFTDKLKGIGLFAQNQSIYFPSKFVTEDIDQIEFEFEEISSNE
jgi:hypothetical protein